MTDDDLDYVEVTDTYTETTSLDYYVYIDEDGNEFALTGDTDADLYDLETYLNL